MANSCACVCLGGVADTDEDSEDRSPAMDELPMNEMAERRTPGLELVTLEGAVGEKGSGEAGMGDGEGEGDADVRGMPVPETGTGRNTGGVL
jgi:hypothetical protein